MSQDEEWENLKNDFIIKYKVGYEGDAKKTLDYAIYARKLLEMQYFHTLPKRKVSIYLYEKVASTPGGNVNFGKTCANREEV